ncbi:hypothetical protein ABIA39_008531 [Nocardia sp. GAS34]|uniref:sugar transferase n=1 Tax=unclassified Nocardia TaxID=2637762 RepID=UPI003D1B9428
MFTPEDRAEINDIKAKLIAIRDPRGNPPFADIIARWPDPAPGEIYGADFLTIRRRELFEALHDRRFKDLREIKLTPLDILDLKRVIRHTPAYLTLGAGAAFLLKAEQLLRLPGATPGPLIFTQLRRLSADEMLETRKLRTLTEGHPEQSSTRDIADHSSSTQKVLRTTSGDEILQIPAIAFGYLSFLGTRVILDRDVNRTESILEPDAGVRWRQSYDRYPKALWALGFPPLRDLTPGTIPYLQARAGFLELFVRTASPTLYNFYLNEFVDPYIIKNFRSEMSLLQSNLRDDLSARFPLLAPIIGGVAEFWPRRSAIDQAATAVPNDAGPESENDPATTSKESEPTRPDDSSSA